MLSRLDHGNIVLSGISVHLLKRLQSVINSAARLFFSSSKFDLVTPLLRQRHWLSALWQINFKLAVFAFKCLHGLAPSYLADELHHPAETEFRQRLRSASSPALSVPRTRLSTLRRPSFPGRRCSRLKQSSSARHICVDTSAFVSRHTIIIFVIRSRPTFVRACEVTSSFWTR